MSAATAGRRWRAPAAWAALLLTATSWPRPRVPDIAYGDKTAHLALYAVLAFLVARAMAPRGGAVRLLSALAATLTFAAVDEWHQRFIPGRTASLADFAADAAGATAGVVAAAAFAGSARVALGPRDARA